MNNRQSWINKSIEIACLMRGFDHDLRMASMYAEPGYSDPESGVIAFADWNERIMAHTDGKISQTMPRLRAILEYFGAEIEWSDEWTVCDCCGKAVRTQPDSYAWKPSYWCGDDGEAQCHECVEECADDYVDYLNGNKAAAVTFDFDLKEHGYVRLKKTWAAGLHPGQMDNPSEIASTLRDIGCYNFIFEIESQEQFSTYFRVWLTKDDYAIYRKHRDAQSEKSA
jgi:hypothetical protein